MQLIVTVKEREPGVFMISPEGSLDSSTCQILEKEVDSVFVSKPKTIILNMQGVTYISSAGLRVVFKTKKAIEHDLGKFYMVNLIPSVKKVFDIVNAIPKQNIFSGVFTSVEELDDYLDAMQREDK